MDRAGPGRGPAGYPGRAGLRRGLARTALSLLALAGAALGRQTAGDAASRLRELAERCIAERPAAQELEQLLIDGQLTLEAGERVPAELLVALHFGARSLPFACVPEGERELKDESAYALARMAALAHPDPELSAELLADVALELGRRLRDAGRLDEALGLLREAQGHSPPPRRRSAALRTAAAEILRFQQAWQEAEDLLRAAGPELEKEPDEVERRATALTRELVLGRLDLDLGRIDRASKDYQRAAEIAQACPAAHRQRACLEQAAFLLAVEDFAAAARLLAPLLADAELAPELRGTAWLRLGIANELAGLAAGRVDPAVAEDLRRALAAPLSRAERVECELRRAELALATGALAGADEALERAEREAGGAGAMAPPLRARAVTLRARTARLGAGDVPREAELRAHRAALLDVQAELLSSWARLPARDDGVGFLHFGSRQAPLGELCALELALDARLGPERCLEHLAEAQLHGTLARRMELRRAPRGAEIRAALSAGQVLLAYLLAPDQSWLFVADADSVEAHRLESRWTLLGDMRAFAEVLGTPPASLGAGALREEREARLAKLGCDLGLRLLPAAVQARLRAARHVSVVGEELLGPFPFEALELAGGARVGTSAAVDHWLSIPVGVQMVRRWASRPLAGRGLAFVAPRHPAPQFPALDASAASRALTEAWPELEVRALDEASEARLRSTELGAARALLFLAHGLEDPERALPAGIVLAPSAGEDGFVWCEDVFRLAAPPLVVLGVCGAGRGHERRGEDGATHLGGAWLQAGAACVVASPFALEERSTVRLLAALGRGRARGLSVAEALRAGRREVEKELPDPYYHELLQVLGAGL